MNFTSIRWVEVKDAATLSCSETNPTARNYLAKVQHLIGPGGRDDSIAKLEYLKLTLSNSSLKSLFAILVTSSYSL